MSTSLYPAIILAGGLATRLRPLTATFPKSMIPINGEPFIAHQLRLLKRKGISHVILCIGFLGEQIQTFVGDGKKFGISVDYSFDGDVLLGTGGAIKKALRFIQTPFFILYGDSYLECDYASIQSAYEKNHKIALMTVYKNENQWDKSNVEFNNQQILLYDKTKQTANMHYIDYGLGIADSSAFDILPNDNNAYDLAMVYQHLLKQNQLAGYEVQQRFFEIGSFSGIQELEAHLTSSSIPLK